MIVNRTANLHEPAAAEELDRGWPDDVRPAALAGLFCKIAVNCSSIRVVIVVNLLFSELSKSDSVNRSNSSVGTA